MKVTRDNVKELRKHLEDLGLAIERLDTKADHWLDLQADKARWGSGAYMQEMISTARIVLDNELDEFTEFLAWLYDYLHTERRAYEVPTGKYLQSLRDAGIEENGEGSSEESNDPQQEILS